MRKWRGRGAEARPGARPHTYLPSRAEVISKAGARRAGEGRARLQSQRRGAPSGPPSPEGGAGFLWTPQQDPERQEEGRLGFSPSATTREPHAGPSARCQLRNVEPWLPKQLHLAPGGRGPAAGWLLPGVANRCSSTTCSPQPRAEAFTVLSRLLNGAAPTDVSLGATVGQGRF